MPNSQTCHACSAIVARVVPPGVVEVYAGRRDSDQRRAQTWARLIAKLSPPYSVRILHGSRVRWRPIGPLEVVTVTCPKGHRTEVSAKRLLERAGHVVLEARPTEPTDDEIEEIASAELERLTKEYGEAVARALVAQWRRAIRVR